MKVICSSCDTELPQDVVDSVIDYLGPGKLGIVICPCCFRFFDFPSGVTLVGDDLRTIPLSLFSLRLEMIYRIEAAELPFE